MRCNDESLTSAQVAVKVFIDTFGFLVVKYCLIDALSDVLHRTWWRNSTMK